MSQKLDFSHWVGRRRRDTDYVSLASVAAMAAALDRDDAALRQGMPLPPLWHWMYFTAKEPTSALGPDGHPPRGGFMPPVALARRMFAGGRMNFYAPLRVGETVRRDGEIARVAHKQGRSGDLVFVTARYRIFGPAGLAIEEEQDIVYCDPVAPGATGPARDAADLSAMPWQRAVTPDPVLLFRYSALTFNGHRIHYDHVYATQVEGYPGLVVHGPLIATLLMELCREATGGRPVHSFQFRARRPIFATAPFTVAGGPGGNSSADLVAIDREGAVAMTAGVAFAA